MAGSLVGVGLYSIKEAARLLQADSRELRRWIFGYTSTDRAGERRSHPNVSGNAPYLRELGALTFFELLEARLIKGLRGHKVSLQSIRSAVAEAQRIFHDPHPFVLKRIESDGRSIFAKAAAETDDEPLLDLLKRQYVFDKIVRQSLLFGVDFEAGRAARWFPTTTQAIVIDPARAFGKPIVARDGVPTETLYAAFLAEGGDVARVSRIYQVPAADVSRAVRFEKSLGPN